MSKIDLAPYFMKLQGQQYLKVAGRVLLFREQHPTGGIYTELIQLDLDKGFCLYKAIVLTGDGAILSTAYGSETQRGFPAGWVEKAETVAVGRALAAAGFGTQFALADFHEVGGDEKLADAPVAPPKPKQAPPQGVTKNPSPEQIKRLWAIVKTAGLTPDALKEKMVSLGMPAATGDLDMGQYATLIAWIEGRQ